MAGPPQAQKLCPSCGNSVLTDANICSTCGYNFNTGPYAQPPSPAGYGSYAPPFPGQSPQPQPHWQSNYPRGYSEETTGKEGLAIASLVLGIISLALFCVWYLAIPCAILAIIFGAIGKNSANRKMAVAGLVLGISAIAVVILFIVVIVGIVMANGFPR